MPLKKLKLFNTTHTVSTHRAKHGDWVMKMAIRTVVVSRRRKVVTRPRWSRWYRDAAKGLPVGYREKRNVLKR